MAVAAPQNQPAAGQLIDAGELRDAARARVEVTMSVLSEYGIDSVGEVMDPHSALALDDAVRAHDPGEVLLSCLDETRFGFTRKDLVEWARKQFEPEVKVTHIPVRIMDDSIRLDVIHTLVVATQTVAAPDLVSRLKQRAASRPHRYTIVCPRTEGVSEPEVARDLASTLAELYRADIDATGQPMSPDPFLAVKNAIEHYQVDEVLISTFSGEQSRWLEDDLIGRVREITEKPVEHLEVGRGAEAVAAAVAEGGRPDGERIGRPRARPRRGAPRAAGGQPELADRPPDARDLPLHRLRGDAVRRLLRRLLLPPRGRQSRRPGRRSRSSSRSWSAFFNTASSSPRASRSTTRWSRSSAATGTGSNSASS